MRLLSFFFFSSSSLFFFFFFLSFFLLLLLSFFFFFLVHRDQAAFFRDFAAAYGKLLALGCPAACQPDFRPPVSDRDQLSAEFRELCMHGSLEPAMALSAKCDVHALEDTSNRSALHKAAFWGHNELVRVLVTQLKLSPNTRDSVGDTPLHDAVRFGHETVARHLLAAGADTAIRNNHGQTALDVAVQHGYTSIAQLIQKTKL